MIELLFPILLGEAVLGGGGRTFAVGSVTLRMLLFAAALIASFVGMATSSRKRDGLALANFLVLAFFISLLPGLLVDASRGTPPDVIWAGLQPLLFWLTTPFFALALQNGKEVQRATTIIIIGSVAIAAVTSFLMIGLYFGFVGFGSLYVWSEQTEELFFRGSTNFFYKGHFFVGIGLIFCVILRPKWWKTMAAALILSLALSLTRGFYVAVAISILLSLLSQRRPIFILIAVGCGLAATWFYGEFIFDILLDPSRIESSNTRTYDTDYFLVTFDYQTVLMGEGFGSLLNGRANIENSYIWVFWRFGIIGIIFMMAPLVICARYHAQVPRTNEYRPLADAYFFGVVMLYIVTAINPFVNNSIGLIFLFCALFCLRRLSRLVAAPPPPIGLIA